MNVLILKNVESEGPGTIGDYLRDGNFPFNIIELSKGEPIPPAEGYDCLVILGGPMSVNEEDRYPYITSEINTVKDFIAGGKKILGICLGAQIIAKALGSRVYKGSAREIGWFDIEFSYNGMIDPNIRKLAMHPSVGDIWQRIKVFHWHGETFDIPTGAVHLAGSELFPNQAFRYNGDVYALQFHVEVTKEIVLQWLGNEDIDLNKIKEDTEKYFNVYNRRAYNFYDGFFKADYSY